MNLLVLVESVESTLLLEEELRFDTEEGVAPLPIRRGATLECWERPGVWTEVLPYALGAGVFCTVEGGGGNRGGGGGVFSGRGGGGGGLFERDK